MDFCTNEIVIHLIISVNPHEGKELNATRLWKLAKKITSAEELLTLAIEGLCVDEDNVDGHLNSNNNIHIISYNVLRDWQKDQPNPKVAYTKLCDALGKVGKVNYTLTALK